MTIATTYTELMAGIQAQVVAMGIRQVDFDGLAGFPAGWSGKAFGLLQTKRLGPEKIFDALRAAGLRLRLEVDPDQLARMQRKIAAEMIHPRQASQARPGHASTTPSSAVLSRVFKAMGRRGGKVRWAGKSKKERQEHMRMMGIASGRKRARRRRAK